MAELASIKLNPETHLLLDQPLLKVPYELARKNLKTSQRHLERERDTLLASLKTAASSAAQAHDQNGDGAEDPALTTTTTIAIDAMIARMENLKRKLESLHTEEQTNHKHTRARIQHLQELHDIPTLADVKYDQWAKVRLDRLLVDYLLRCGYGQSAMTLAKEVGIEELVDVEAFVQCSKVEASLMAGRTQEALAWCNENKQALKKMNNDLEYELRLQQYIELIRTRQTTKLLEATAHARKYLAAHPDPSYAIRAAGLLAFPPTTPIEPYKSLYSTTRYPHLTSLFLRTHHTLLSLPTHPALNVALSAGLSALKTPSCHSIHTASSGNASTSTSGTSVCPICSTELNELARGVPYAHHAKSSVDGEQVVLPNGRVYGKERLRALNEKMGGVGGEGAEAGGRVRDPMTGDWFGWGEVKKVYIL